MQNTKTPNTLIGKYIPLIGIGIVLLLFCVNTHKYYYLTLQHYFSFLFCAIAFSSIVLLWRWAAREKFHITFSTLIMAVWGIFIVLHTIFIVAPNTYETSYLFSSILYFYSLAFFFRKQIVTFEMLYACFALMALIQSIVCILQFTGIAHSADPNFEVMGTLNNPNITAMYLVISSPYFISKFLKKQQILFHVVVLAILLFAVLLLKCRTAYIGLITIALTYILKHETIRDIWKKWSKWLRFGIIMSSIPLVCGLFTALYFQKKASADGRIFVWKVAIEMVKEEPLKGYGYGLFEKEYNLAQAKYFVTHQTTATEKNNARYVFMPYNDFIHQAIQGGLLGALVFVLLILYFVYLAIRQKDIQRSSIVMAVVVMMCLNFTVQAIPVWILFLTAAAALTTQEVNELVVVNKKLIHYFGFIGSGILIVFLFHQLHKKQAQEDLKIAVKLYEYHQIPKAAALLKTSFDAAGSSEAYLRRYGGMLIALKRTKEGCELLERATQFSSATTLNFDLAKGYEQCNEFAKAEQRFLLVRQMIPTNYRSRFKLMKLYQKIGKLNKARFMALEIMGLPDRKDNKEIQVFRQQASIINLFVNRLRLKQSHNSPTIELTKRKI